MKSKKKDKHYSNNRKYIYLGLMLFVLTVMLIEPTYCAIADETMKSIGQDIQSKVFDGTIILLMVFGAGTVINLAMTKFTAAWGCGAAFLFGVCWKIYSDKGGGALLVSASQFFDSVVH